MKRCPHCGEHKPRSEFYKNRSTKDGYQQYCKLCTKIKVEQWRTTNSEAYARVLAKRTRKKGESTRWARKNREKRKAQWAVFYALKTGRLTKPGKCEECSEAGRIEGHHDDYSQPLVVRWLCTRCHGHVHVELRSA